MPDLIGLQEIAAIAGVTTSAVSNWRTRDESFPAPLTVLAGGPVFDAGQVRRWLGRRSGKVSAEMEGKPKCLVISPIGNELAPVGHPDRERWERSIETWERVIEPACVVVGLEVIRADQISRAGEITEQVFSLIRDAEFVIADVTAGNPNVMYELGLRHTVNKCTIQIGEFGQLPFDIAAVRTLQFSRTPAGLVDARKKLEAALTGALAGHYDPVTATRLWASPSVGEMLRVSAEQAVPQVESEEPGVFELLATMEGAFPELSKLSESWGAVMLGMAAAAEAATAEVRRNDVAKLGFAGRLRVANQLADTLSPIADEFEELAQAYEGKLASIDAGMSCLLDMIEENPSELAEAKDFPHQIGAFVRTMRDVNKKQADFASTIVGGGRFSKPLRIVTRRIADATRRVAKALALAEVWDSRLRQLAERTTPASVIDGSVD
jgi:hypothetical protein